MLLWKNLKDFLWVSQKNLMSYFYIITDKLKLFSKIFRVEIMDQENRLNLIFGIIFIKYLKYLKTVFFLFSF